MASSIELTPQERLAISRKAIVRHMNRHHRDIEDSVDDDIDEADTRDATTRGGTWSTIKYAARMWWYRHPASAAVELAGPLLGDYASVHPFKLLGISAATGAAIVVIRPWRMLSASTLLVAAVKFSGLSNTLITMISSFTRHSSKPDTRQ
ncbi:hypothetical protein BH10PSE16_BH10PSE16_38210 [soil metagenome]